MGGLNTALAPLGESAAFGTSLFAEVTDGFSASYLIEAIRAQSATATSGIGVASSFTIVRGIVMLERLRIALSEVDNHKFQKTLTEALGVDSALLPAALVTLSQGVGLHLTQQTQQAITVLEELGLLPVVVPLFKYHLTTAEAIAVASTLSRFLGSTLSEGVGIAPTQSVNMKRSGALTQGVGVAATISPRLILRAVVAEDIGIDSAEALRMLFKPIMREGIELSAAYLSPGGGVTTWAMNTRTSAVTEYTNYDFNSFARMGDKYIGASSSGLYELLGDDDDGTDIIAQLKSGFAQWAGSKFTLFKGIYMGVRGEGDFVLRLITGDGKTYNYGVTTRDVRSTKVHLGKGLRARYFAFELISAGQDFELDTIEFVPLVAERRV